MRIVVVIVFALALVAVAGAAVVAAREAAELDGAGGGPGPVVRAGSDGDAVAVAKKTARAIVKAVSGSVTPEMADALVRLVDRGERKGADYRLWRDFLEQQRAAYGVTSVYALVKLDRETAGVVVEAVEDADATDAWLAAYEIEAGMRKAFRGRVALGGGGPFFDPRVRGGSPHVRALAPVRDGAGEVVAIVGLDLEVGDRRVAR